MSITRLKRLEVLGNPQAQTGAPTASGGRIPLARHIALGIVRLGGIVGEHHATPALLAELGAGKGVALLLAGSEALFRGKGCGVQGEGVRQRTTQVGLVSVAAEGLVILDSDLVGSLGERGILPDR